MYTDSQASYPEACQPRERFMFPVRVYAIVAVITALIAFGMGQLLPGSGVVFVVLASTMWTAYSANRQRRLQRDC